MRILRCTAVALAIASMSVMLQATPAVRGQLGQQPQAVGDANAVARRAYLGVLGREADAVGLASATTEVQRGRLSVVVDGMLKSTEFANLQRTKTPEQLLEQFSVGFLWRTPDAGLSQMFLPRVQQRKYAEVIMTMANSEEFRNKLGTQPIAATVLPAAPAPVVRLDAALACQARVIDAVRSAAGGRVFVTFDRMPTVSDDGQTVSGPAMDRVVDKGERDMTYRCAGKDVSFTYADRRAPVAMDVRERFPSAAVRNCQNAVKDGLTFDAASLSASESSAEYVLGFTGGAVKQCTMDRERVVPVK